MDEYTPSTEEVRLVVIDGRWNTGAIDAEMFDRWLAARDRVVAANAWEQSKATGESIQRRRWSDEPNAPEPNNPYRITEED